MKKLSIKPKGHFGEFGGQYVAEILMPALNELEEAYFKLTKTKAFKDQWKELAQNEIDDLKVKYYEQVRWNNDYNQRIKNLKDELDSLGIELGLAYMNTIPFQFEFGSAYFRFDA